MKNKLIYGMGALAGLVLAAVIGSQVLAGTTSGDSGFLGFGRHMGIGRQLTDAQKAEMKAKTDAVKAAEDAGDYAAWVAAIKAMDSDSPILQKVASEDSFKNYLSGKKQREQEMRDRVAKMDRVDAALESGNFEAWTAAVKALDQDCPLLTRINSENFSKYLEAYKLKKQAQSIMEGLGLDGDDGKIGAGFGRMHGKGMDRMGLKFVGGSGSDIQN